LLALEFWTATTGFTIVPGNCAPVESRLQSKGPSLLSEG